MPKVTIIITVHKDKSALRESLESALAQTHEDIEVFVLDKSSSRETASVIESLREERVPVTLLRGSRTPHLKNLAIRRASGDYLCFLHSGDVLRDNMAERCLELTADSPQIVTFDAEVKMLVEPGWKPRYSRKLPWGSYSGRDFIRLMEHSKVYNYSSCLLFIQREFLKREGIFFWEDILHEDRLFTAVSLMNAERINYTNYELYEKRITAELILNEKRGISHLLSKGVVLETLSTLSDEEWYRKHLLDIWWGMSFDIRRISDPFEKREALTFMKELVERYSLHLTPISHLKLLLLSLPLSLPYRRDSADEFQYKITFN